MRLVIFLLLAGFAVPQGTEFRKAERFAGVLNAGPLSPQPSAIDIAVDRWATDASRGRLAAVFQSGGLPAFLDAIKKEGAAGYVRLQNHERLVAGYVEQESRPDGGRRILLLCVRYPGDWELTRDVGWTDHVFRIVALTLDAKDKGTGMIFHTAKVAFGASGVELVSELSGQPTKILSVQKTR
jgi:hypothetical protein